MKRIETSVVIQIPIDQVFAYVIEPANLPEWGTRVTIAEQVSAPWILRPAEWIFGYMAGKNIDKYGPALKKRLEETG